jgi:NADH-quinone oxidoreductase subunit L
MMVLGLLLAYYFYIRRPNIPSKIAGDQEVLYKFLLNKWYFDEIYDFLFVKPTVSIGRLFWKAGDENIINKYGPDGISKQVIRVTKKLVQLQSGLIYHYAFSMIIGLSIFITFYIIIGRG